MTFLTAVRHEVNNLESSTAMQNLKLAINILFYRLLLSLGNQYNVGTLYWFPLALTPKCRAVRQPCSLKTILSLKEGCRL